MIYDDSIIILAKNANQDTTKLFHLTTEIASTETAISNKDLILNEMKEHAFDTIVLDKKAVISLYEQLFEQIFYTPADDKMFKTKETIDGLKTIITHNFNITIAQMESKSSNDTYVKARQLFFTMLYADGYGSLKTIGSLLNKNHATVLHSKLVIQQLYETKDIKYYSMISKVIEYYNFHKKLLKIFI